MSLVFLNFLCAVVIVALGVKFARTLAEKFGWLEWLQVHVTNKFFSQLLSCEFCQSFWLAVVICIVVFIITGYWAALLVPIFSCNIR